MSQIFQRASNGNAAFFLQFGGQGSPWYKELKSYYADPKMKRFFDAALRAVEEERSTVEGTVGLPHGINAKLWLDDETKIPSDEYLGCAAVSIPMIQMTQLAHFENLTLSGYDRTKLIAYSLGATGHSQGLIPACLVSMNLEGDDYYAGVAKFMKYMIYLGVRAQETHPHFTATEEETRLSQELGEKGSPAPMVAVLGETHDDIKKLVDETNATLPVDKKIYISLFNSPTNRILSSYRSSLVAFHKAHKARMDEKKTKFVYLRTTCPFHCPLMEPIRKPFEADIARLGVDYKGSQIKVPVYSFFDGRNMQKDANLPIQMYEDMAIHNLHWEKSVKPVADNRSITHILDFGPGKVSQRLTADTLAQLSCETSVYAAAVPKDLKELLA